MKRILFSMLLIGSILLFLPGLSQGLNYYMYASIRVTTPIAGYDYRPYTVLEFTAHVGGGPYNVTSVDWVWGDGVVYHTQTNFQESEQRAYHAYDRAGWYLVILNATLSNCGLFNPVNPTTLHQTMTGPLKICQVITATLPIQILRQYTVLGILVTPKYTNFTMGAPFVIYGHVQDSKGRLIENGLVTLYSAMLDKKTSYTTMLAPWSWVANMGTDYNGSYYFLYRPPQPGRYAFNVTYQGDERYEPTSAIYGCCNNIPGQNLTASVRR